MNSHKIWEFSGVWLDVTMVTWFLNEISWDIVIKESWWSDLLVKRVKKVGKRDFSLVKESFSNMSAPMISRENARCAILLVKESPHAVLKTVFRSLLQRKLSFTEQVSYLSIAKSDEIGKIAHLTFFLEIMGADILEKLSLTNEKSLFVSNFITFSNAQIRYLFCKTPFSTEILLMGTCSHTGNSL